MAIKKLAMLVESLQDQADEKNFMRYQVGSVPGFSIDCRSEELRGTTFPEPFHNHVWNPFSAVSRSVPFRESQL